MAMTEIDLLRHPLHSGHLTVGALKRNKNRPVLFLGDTTMTGGELADRISCYIQAFEALGAGTDATVGLLALNRPEVLMIIGAGQTQGYRRTALHPLGSLDDHAYVLSDVGQLRRYRAEGANLLERGHLGQQSDGTFDEHRDRVDDQRCRAAVGEHIRVIVQRAQRV